MENKSIIDLVGFLKSSILHSQYKAAKFVNSEMVQLYYFLGFVISIKVKQKEWGEKALEQISIELKKELKNLKGFSSQNLKKMKRFAEAYPQLIAHNTIAVEFSQNARYQLFQIGSALPTQFEKTLDFDFVSAFWNISFTNHINIINKMKSFSERCFYIDACALHSWSSRVLENHLKNQLHLQSQLTNNFALNPEKINSEKAIRQFRDEYLLDFLNIDDADEERIIEDKIVQNIKDFILHLGKGFAFIGNQFPLTVEGDEYFIDLLFYNRALQSLVAVELKRGKFKPQHVGQLGFYLSALDQQMRFPNENPSIGIVLCKEKNNTVVEYALRNVKVPLGVATFKTTEEMPENIQNILPSVAELERLLN